MSELQSRLSQLVTGAGATILSSQALPETKERGLTKVKVSATFQADVKTLSAILHAVERARPMNFLEKLSVRDPDGDFPGAPLPKPEANKLQVDLVIAAYMRP